jgi:hypothetical protein
MVVAATLALPVMTTPMFSGGGAARAEEPVVADYAFYFGGLHVLTAQARFATLTDAYTVEAEGETQGILSFVFEWKGVSRTEGRFEGNRAIPSVHESRGNNSDEERLQTLRYDETGAVIDVVVQPKPDPDEVTPLPENAEVGTIDPLTVIAAVGRAVSQGEGCSGTFPVFDGKRRYDLTVTDEGMRTLEPTDYSVFSGPALACHVAWESLGGQRREKSKYAKTARDRTIYVARPFEDSRPIPVSLSIETDYGTLKGHMTGVEAGGRRLAVTLD